MAPRTLDAAPAGAAGASSLSMSKKAVPSSIGIIAELRGVMHELHVGRGFLYPPALPATAAIWGKCTDKEVTSTLSFLRQELLLEQIELQAKLLNFFLGSNKSNINQSRRNSEAWYSCL